MLQAQGLTKNFGAVRAVDGLDISVAKGEIVALLGPNGAGKTTSVRMLAGVLTPDGGTVMLDGIALEADPLAVKRRIGFLSGDTQLYRRMTVREVLRYFGQLYGMEPARIASRIEYLVDALEMRSFVDRMCATFSSGQKQRANIARAFLHEPDVLILDEPTAALDVLSGHFIIEAIRAQKAAGRAILFSTHIMSEAEYLCDRIVLLHEGRILDEGSPAELNARSGCQNLTDTFLHLVGGVRRPAEANS